MSNSEAKRKVMGRVEMPLDRSSPLPRVSATTSNGVRKGPHVRAKVDMSSFSVPSPQSQPSPYSIDTTPQSQHYFNRPKRPNDNSFNNNFSSGPSSNVSASPSVSIHSSTSNFASSPHTPRVLRSPSPVRQLQRNPPSTNDANSSYLNGPIKVPKERTSATPVSGHARVNSSQISVVGGEITSRGQLRAGSSVSTFVNGNSYGRSRINSANSTRSRSPSPSEARTSLADRRISQSSTTSSTISVTNRQPASMPVVRAQKSFSTISRPPLKTTFSSASGTYSPTEAQSPSLTSPSIAATIAKLPPYRDSSNGESSTQAPLQSPPSDLAPQAQDAKKNRKILDLEITNRSLLAINSGLEVVKLKQAREIRELKKRLREGRSLDASLSLDADEDEDDFDGEDDSQTLEEEGTMDLELEMAHTRCKNMVDAMVNKARESILYKYDMDPKHKGTSRVLHPAELEMMQSEGTLDEAQGEAARSPMPLPSSNNDEIV